MPSEMYGLDIPEQAWCTDALGSHQLYFFGLSLCVTLKWDCCFFKFFPWRQPREGSSLLATALGTGAQRAAMSVHMGGGRGSRWAS